MIVPAPSLIAKSPAGAALRFLAFGSVRVLTKEGRPESTLASHSRARVRVRFMSRTFSGAFFVQACTHVRVRLLLSRAPRPRVHMT